MPPLTTLGTKATVDREGTEQPEVNAALIARSVQGLTMMAAAICVAWRFSLNEQGLFFVFLSLATLVQLGEFGSTYATLQAASDPELARRAGRKAALQRTARFLNGGLTATAALAVGLAGTQLFASTSQTAVVWLAPWWTLVVGVGAYQLINLELALVEGLRSASLAWRVRAAQESVAGILFIGALLVGCMLWSLAIYWGARFAIGALLLRRSAAQTMDTPRSLDTDFAWRREIWPFQWRVGVSSLSGFLIFQSFNPIILLELGSTAAARFGMALAVMNLLLMVTTAWPISQASRCVRLITQRRLPELHQVFRRLLLGSTLLAVALTAAVMASMVVMRANDMDMAAKFADLPTSALLLGAGLVHHIVACLAVVLRAERREPLLGVSVGGGLLTVAMAWMAAHFDGLQGIALANLACTLLGLAVCIWHFRRFSARLRRLQPNLPVTGSA